MRPGRALAAGEVGDLSGETAETLALYHCDDPHRPTASYGHFGRKEFSWEKTDRAAALRADAKLK